MPLTFDYATLFSDWPVLIAINNCCLNMTIHHRRPDSKCWWSSLTWYKGLGNTLTGAGAGGSTGRIHQLYSGSTRRREQRTPSGRMFRHQLRHAQLPYVDGRRFRFEGYDELLGRPRWRQSSLHHHTQRSVRSLHRLLTNTGDSTIPTHAVIGGRKSQ